MPQLYPLLTQHPSALHSPPALGPQTSSTPCPTATSSPRRCPTTPATRSRCGPRCWVPPCAWARMHAGLGALPPAAPRLQCPQPADAPSHHRPAQWALPRISAPSAWDVSTGGAAPGFAASASPATVCVIDSGVDASHPDLAANLHPEVGWSAVEGVALSANADHGTHVGEPGGVTSHCPAVALPAPLAVRPLGCRAVLGKGSASLAGPPTSEHSRSWHHSRRRQQRAGRVGRGLGRQRQGAVLVRAMFLLPLHAAIALPACRCRCMLHAHSMTS